MGSIPYDGALQFNGDAIEVATVNLGVTSEIAIPTTSSGERAQLVYIQAQPQILYKPGFTGGTALDGMRARGHDAVVINVSGYTHLLATSATGNSRRISVAPLENSRILK